MIDGKIFKEIMNGVAEYLGENGYSKLNVDSQAGAVGGTPGNWTPLKIQVPMTTIYSSDWNAEFQNVVNNSNPDGLASASTTIAEMQATRDPYIDDTPVLNSSLRGDIEELRFQIQSIIDEPHWYISIGNKKLVTGGDCHNHLGTDVDEECGGGALIGTDAIEDGAITIAKISDTFIFVDKITEKLIPAVQIPWQSAFMPNGLDAAYPILPGSGYELISISYNPAYDPDDDNKGCVIIEYNLSVLVDAPNDVLVYVTSILVDNVSNTILNAISQTVFTREDMSLIMTGRYIVNVESADTLNYSIRIGDCQYNNQSSGTRQLTISALQHSQSFITMRERYITNV